MLKIDLHCHSTISDGLFTPTQIIEHAASRHIQVLALTDHDDVAGIEEASVAAREKNITFIAGVEISVTWQNKTLHILGLGIDPQSSSLVNGLSTIREGRIGRAQNIARQLDKFGIHGSFEGAQAYASKGKLIGRTHFARFLVEKGHAKDVRSVFKKYLVKGKPGYVSHQWASLSDAVNWINSSGGQAVIAHPGRYQLNKRLLESLLNEFQALGGLGIEIVSPSHSPEQIQLFAQYSNRLNLFASCGSDFHGPGESHFDLGQIPPLPANCTPIWQNWEI